MRGKADVGIRRTRLVAVILEGQVLASETLTAAENIHNAAMVGARGRVLNEAGRLTLRAQAAQAEFRALAAGAEE